AAVTHGRVDQRGKGCRKLVSVDEHRTLQAATAQCSSARQRLRDSRRAGSGENGAECVEDMILGRAQRVAVKRLVTRTRQIAGDLLCQCAAADHGLPRTKRGWFHPFKSFK